MQSKLMVKLLLTFITLIVSNMSYGQIYLQTEYITQSKFKDEEGNELGKGRLKTIDGGAKIPISIRMDDNDKPVGWVATINGTYASLDNKNLSKDYSMSEILNVQVGIIYMHPLSEKWSMIAMLGAGVFTSDLNKISGKSILGQGGALFIWHLRSNFDLGAGASMSTALGYPMLFPTFYVDWRLDGKYQFSLSMLNSFKASISTSINDNFKLGIVGEFKGLMSAVEKEGKDKYFVTQYGYVGLMPEFILGKSFSLPITAGISFSRDTYFQDKTLKAFLETKDKYPQFQSSAYFSVGIKYGFKQ